ncbi:MAG: hypothetical protein AMXMBFR31_03040 [Candidatus Desulfobacillus denitrificans]|nr:hypothetical protein [Rhodocyclaceae bacterium]
MPAPVAIRQLVERFEANLDTYRGGYNETLIDRLVYELYGLTEEEIAVVEGNGTA